jgi:hypothetical protein
MSVWRNFLATVLPWIFKTGEAAANAAVNKQDVGKAASNAVEGIESDPAILAAAQAAADKTVKSITKGKK